MRETRAAKLSVSRLQSNMRDDLIRIRVECEVGMATVNQVIELSPQDFALALTGLSDRPCTVGGEITLVQQVVK